MRALSLRQAARCETAKHKTCRCRCHGALHGAMRNFIEEGRQRIEEREFYETLPKDDPHHLPTREETRRKRKDAAYVKRSGKQGLLWAIFEGENA